MNPSEVAGQLLELFNNGPLRGVRFPDADAERLRGALDVATAAKEALGRAEAEVENARAALADAERSVAHETERTVAYVEVYAAGRPELRAALDAVTARPSRSGRRRKGRSADVDPSTEAGTVVPAAAE